MVGFRLSLGIIFLLSSLISPMSFAKGVTLKTIKVSVPSDYGTLKAEIHFDEKDIEVALKAEKIIKTDLIKTINYFKHVPENTVHFNVDPYLRLTNGNATPFPTNTINLYKFPASNNEHLVVFDDWLRGLIFHEYIHITHLDQTRGFLEVGRKIFGNIVKIVPAITPRWFPEGIAVWGESHLLNEGGRLNNPLFKKELLIQFLRSEYCTTLDCLDEPGVYPNGQLAYWAGAQFMEYLEDKKAGTIKCLVEDNSDNFIFILNSVFRRCAGNNAQTLFDQFRSDMIANQPKQTPENEAWGDKISNAFGSDDLQKGVILDGNILFKVEQNREREALLSYDLQENVNMLSMQYNYPISDLAGITTMPAVDDEQSDHGKFLVVAFNEDPRFRQANRTWKLVNTETLLVEATLPLQNDPSYVIGLGNNRFLTASFIDNKWKIERQRVDITNNKSEVEVLYEFSSNLNITFFKREDQKIFIKYNDGKQTTLAVSDLTLEKFYELYTSPAYFDTPVITDKFLVVRNHGKLSLIEVDDDLKSSTTSEMGKDLLNRVTSAELNAERVLVLENRLKTKNMTLDESLKYLKQNSLKPSKTTLTPVSFEKRKPVDMDQVNTEPFPKLNHMRPHYWFLAGDNVDNLTKIGAFTSMNDPMDVNNLSLQVLTYPSESKIGGSAAFVHRFMGVSDLWSAYATFNREFSKTDFNDVLSETTEAMAGTRYAFFLKRWTWIPGLYGGTKKTTDFLSSRQIDYYGTSQVVNYQALSFDDYFQSLFFQVNMQNDMPDKGDSYGHLQSSLTAEGRFYERIIGGVKSSYGKLFKSSLLNGDVINGGGTSTAGTQRWHEFYGLPYGNAYGNEIFTFRVYLDYNFWYIYSGPGLFPLYFREAHLLLGRETMTADRIILEKSILRNKTIHSMFIGPRLKMTAFYYMPIDLDLIFSSTTHPNGDHINNFDAWVSIGF